MRRLETEVHRLFAFSSADDLAQALAPLRALPVWSVSFVSPESIAMTRRLPPPSGHPYEEARQQAEPLLPEAYVALLAYPASRAREIDRSLASIVADAHGVDLGVAAAEHEWSQRFSTMRLKRLGPSVVPIEVFVPMDALAAVLHEIGQKVTSPLGLDGMCIKGGQVALLGFILHDQRLLAYNAAFALSLTVTEIARRHGGGAYSTGLFFRQEARFVLGSDKVDALARFKRAHDPTGPCEPRQGDWNWVAAHRHDPRFGPGAGRALHRQRGRRGPPHGRRGVGPRCARSARRGRVQRLCLCAVWLLRTHLRGVLCARLGEPFAARKFRYLREVAEGRERLDQHMVDTFLVCTTCEVCNTRCPLELPVESSWMKLRGRFIDEEHRMTFPPFEMMAASLRGEGDIWAGKSIHRADWIPGDMKSRIAARRTPDVLRRLHRELRQHRRGRSHRATAHRRRLRAVVHGHRREVLWDSR